MKNIGLNIKIGAKIGNMLNGMKSARASIGSVGKTIEKLQAKKIDIIANTKSVKNFSKKIETISTRIDVLKKKKIELQAKIATAKSQTEIDELKAKISQTTRRITVMNNNRLKLKDDLKSAKHEAETTNKSILKIGRTIQKINATKLKIQQTVEKREKFKNNIGTNVARVATVSMPIKTGIEFESAMARVKAITMATEIEFRTLEKTALKLGSSTTFTSTQVAEGMQYLSMAGFKTTQTIKAMPGVLNLASAGALDLASTSDIASNVLSGFGLKSEKMGMVADVMAKAITSANIDVTSLGETMKYAGTPAKALGASLQTVTALTGKLGDVGIKGGEAGTALRSMYLRMASPPKEAQKIIKKLGLSIKDSKGNFVGMIKVLGQLRKKTNGLGNTVKSDYMKKLFGTEAVSAAIALTNKADGTLRKYVKTLEVSSGFAQKMADIQNNTTAGALKRLSSAIEAISIKFSKIFTPAISALADKLSGVGKWLGEMMDKYPKLTSAVTIGATAIIAGGVAFATLGVMAGFAANGVRMLGLSFLANPIGLAITAIAGGAYLIYSNWEKISGFFSSLWSGIKNIFSSAWEGIKSIVSWNPLELIANNWQSIIGFIGGIGSGVKNLLGSAWNGLKNIVSWNPLEFITGRWNGVKNFFSNFSLKSAGKKIISSVVDGMSATWQKLTKKVGDITKSIRDFFPFSPAKRGALTDIHKIKLMETVASGINDKVLAKSVNNATFKAKKALKLGTAGLALSSSIAVAHQTPDVEKSPLSVVPTSFGSSLSSNKEITVNISFGETHIHNDADAKVFNENIAKTIQNALREANREKNNIRMYD